MEATRSTLSRLAVGLLALLTAASLITQLPFISTVPVNLDLLLLYCALTALALLLGVVLGEAELSAAHIVGMVALLSLPESAQPLVLWAVALGGVLGGVLLLMRPAAGLPQPLVSHRSPRSVITVTARVTLSFLVGAMFYRTVGGRLPLDGLLPQDLFPLISFSIVYTSVYFLVFLIEVYTDGRSIPDLLRESSGAILGMLALPIPLALLGAEVYSAGLSPVSFAVFTLGLVVLFLAPYILSRAHYRLRQQLQEIRALSAENTILYERQTSRVEQLATLNSVLSLLTDTLSPETVIDTVITSASVLIDASAVAVYLYWDDPQYTLALMRCAGLSKSFSQEPPDPLLVRHHRNGESAQHPFAVDNVTAAELSPDLRARLLNEGKHALIEIPLSVSSFGFGVLVLYFDRPRTFPVEQVELLRTFGNQVAQAIRNARMYAMTDETLERRVGQLLALAAISHELTATVDMERIGELVLRHALDATGAHAGVVVVMQEAGRPQVLSAIGYPEGAFTNSRVLLHGLTGKVLESGHFVLVADTAEYRDHLPLLPLTRSQLTVPILAEGQIRGAVTLESERAGAFTSDDVQFITQLANQAAIVIENARLFQRVAEARDRLQVILNAMREGIVLVERSGRVALANPRVDLLGLPAEQLVGKPLEDLLDRADLNLAERMGFRSDHELLKLVKEMRSSDPWPGREPVAYVLTSGEKPVYIQRQVIPVHDGQEKVLGALLVFYDESEQRALEQARDDFSHMIVHDLRSPLTAVSTSLKLLHDLFPRDSQFRSVVDTTTDASRRAVRKILTRVDSLLDVARIDSGQLSTHIEAVDLASLAEDVCLELSPVANHVHVMLISTVPRTLPAVAADVDKLERVLQNLADNALKFSPRDSTVIIRAYDPGTRGAPEEFIRVEVVDNGPGVPDEYKQRLFDRFMQVAGHSEARRGTGLGLTFCRAAVEAHGGVIWVEDNPEGGSIFAFTLPVYPADTAPTPGEQIAADRLE